MAADTPEAPAEPGRTFVRVPLRDETIQKIDDILPSLRAFATAHGEPQTGKGDVIALAVNVLHQMVCGVAELVADETRDQFEAMRERERGATEH